MRPARCSLPLGQPPLPHVRGAGSGGGARKARLIRPHLRRRGVGPCRTPHAIPGGTQGTHGLCAGGGAGILFSNGLMQILKSVLVRLRRHIALRSACSGRRAPVGVLRSAGAFPQALARDAAGAVPCHGTRFPDASARKATAGVAAALHCRCRRSARSAALRCAELCAGRRWQLDCAPCADVAFQILINQVRSAASRHRHSRACVEARTCPRTAGRTHARIHARMRSPAERSHEHTRDRVRTRPGLPLGREALRRAGGWGGGGGYALDAMR